MFSVVPGARVVRAGLAVALVVSGAVTVMVGAAGPAAATPDAPEPPHPLIIPNNGLPYGTAAKAGYLPGSSDVSASGAFTYRIPLTVPDGRSGMAPALSLDYSSSGADGPFGLGWSLSGSGSAISRCGKTPDTEGYRTGVHFDKDDRYCLDGQKLIGLGASEPGGSGQYGDHVTEYRTENDSFARIVSLHDPGTGATVDTGPDRFVVEARSGRILTYEARTAARRFDSVSLTESTQTPTPDGPCVDTTTGEVCAMDHDGLPVLSQRLEYAPDPPRVLWLLTEEKDRSGNAIRYEYDPLGSTDGQEFRLGRIRYTFGPGRNAMRRVELGYETRPDPSFSYQNGVRFKQTQRVRSISMFAPNPGATGLVRTYNLSYLPVGPAPGQRSRSLLWQVQECGAQGGCRPAKQFSWAPRVAPSFTTTTLSGAAPVDIGADPPVPPKLHVQDLDGDGSDDVVYTTGGYGTQQWAQLGSRNSAGVVSPLAEFRALNGHGAWPAGGADLVGSRPLDMNGDGSTEFVVRTGPPGHDRVLRWNQASHEFTDTGTGLDVDTAWDDFGDVNGDGLMDRLIGVPLIESDGEGPHANWNELRVAVQLNRGLVFDQPVTSTVDGTCPRRVADVDGDGRADLLIEPPFTMPWPSPDTGKHCGLGASTFGWLGDVVRALKVDNLGQVTEVSGKATDASGAADPGLRFPFMNVQRRGGWFYQVGIFLPIFDTYRNGLYGWRTELGDFNGDGLRDTLLVPTVKNPDGTWERRGAILWGTGAGLYWDGTMVDFAHDQVADLRIGDVNSDGRDDVVSFYNTNLAVDPGPDGEIDTADDQVLYGAGGQDQIAVYLSKGTGAFTVTNLNASAGDASGNPLVGRPFSQLGDFNGDGRLDIVKNDGQLRVMIQDDAQPERVVGVKDEGAGWQRTSVVYSNAWTDHPELMGTVAPCVAPLRCLRRGMTVVRQIISYGDVFASLEDSTATSTYYSYFDPVGHLRRGFMGFGTVRTWSPARPAEVITVFDKRTPAGLGKYYPFAATPKQVTTVVPILTAAQVAQQPAWAKARVTRTVHAPEFRQQYNGATYAVFPDQSTTDVWETQEQVPITWQPNLAGTPATVHVGGIPAATPAATPSHVEELSDYDGYGNLTYHKTETAGGVTEETTNGYDLSPPRLMDWLIGLRTTTAVTRSEAGGTPAPVTRRTENGYDDQGRLTTVWTERFHADPDVRLTVSFGLDPTGVVLTKTTSTPGRPDRVDHTEYDPAFPGQPDELVYTSQQWTEYEPAQYRPSSWQAVHPAFGLTVATEDINGVDTATYHDDLGRPVYATADGAPPAATGYEQHKNVQGDMAGLKTRTVTYLGPPGTPNANVHVAYTITDQLGRARITVTAGFDGTGITTTSDYDPLGRLVSESRPYLYGSAPAGYTVSSFDSLDRPREVRLPNGTKRTWDYSGLFTTDAYDTDDGQTRTITDVNGRTTQTVQYHKVGATVTPIATTYDYAPFDLTRTITDDHGNTTGYAHDVRGRVVSSDDPDRGPSTTAYFGTGEIDTVRHICPTGTTCHGNPGSRNASTYSYDGLGRNISRVDHDGTTGQDTTVSFGYDTAANGVGQLHWASAGRPDEIRTEYRYDGLGRRIGTDYTDQSTTPQTTYRSDTSYDWLGRLDTVTYPEVPGRDRLTIKTAYNGEGYPDTVSDVTGGQQPSALWHAISRNADLALTGAFIGQAGPGWQVPPIGLSREYDDELGHLTGITATRPNGAILQKLDYGYYPNGQLQTRGQADPSANRTESFAYDDLHRLESWTLANAGAPEVTSTYVYDTINNLTEVLGFHGESRTIARPDGTLPHALTAQDGDTFSYDLQGRLIEAATTVNGQSRPYEHLTYTAFDLPRSQTVPGEGTWSFRYDAFGTRVAKRQPDGGGTFYLPGLFEDRTTAAGQHSYVHYLSGPDGAIGQLTAAGASSPATLTFTLTDHLGSTGTTADHTGAPTGSFFYDPHGSRLNPDGSFQFGYSGAVTHGFTGHEHDDDLGQINMKGRIYNAALKAFVTPDPILTNHPYAYVDNNPVNGTDPTGYDDTCFICADNYPIPAGATVQTYSPDPMPSAPASFDPADFAVCDPTFPCIADPAATGFSDSTSYRPDLYDTTGLYPSAWAPDPGHNLGDWFTAKFQKWWNSDQWGGMDIESVDGPARWAAEGHGGAYPGGIYNQPRFTNGDHVCLALACIAAEYAAMRYALGVATLAEATAAADITEAAGLTMRPAPYPLFPHGTLVGALEDGTAVYYGRTATAIGNDSTLSLFLRSRGLTGHDLIMHGAEGELWANTMTLSPERVASIVLGNPYYSPGTPVNAVICHGACVAELEQLIGASISHVGVSETVQLGQTGLTLPSPAAP